MAKFPELDYTVEFLSTDDTAVVGQKIEREKLITFVNTGTRYSEDATAVHFEPLGKGVEDSSLEFDADVSTTRDILGNTETNVNGFTTTQTFDPVYAEVGSQLHKKMLEIRDKKEYSKYSLFDILVIKLFWTKEIEGKVYAMAELHQNCGVYPTSLGGQDYVNMPLNVSYSDDKILGWATYDKTTKTANFYPVDSDVPA